MNSQTSTNPLIVKEYESAYFHKGTFPTEVGEVLWDKYRHWVDIEFPSPRTNNCWKIQSLGWVGQIPLHDMYRLAIYPKVDLNKLFQMLEYAYKLKSFHILKGIVGCNELEDIYEHLAKVLASRVLDRARKGFYRSYVSEEELLPYVRGRMNLAGRIKSPWKIDLHCQYEDHTADIEENQILAWTLKCIAKNVMCTERVLPTVRKAHRVLQNITTLKPYRACDCENRLYNRLNEDYRVLHSFCRFFLEHSGPTHEIGGRTMLPFMVNMARLYEQFVAEWLKANIPKNYSIKSQEKIYIGEENTLTYIIDLVLYDSQSSKPICILDTKYKDTLTSGNEDINEVVINALIKGCTEAFLVYPKPLAPPLDVKIRDVRVRSLCFSLQGNLEVSGITFIQELLEKKLALKRPIEWEETKSSTYYY